MSHAQEYVEQAIPSQYHISQKVVTSLNPTSLRGIQHYSQKTEQATRMLNSYSEFKNECNCGQVNEDVDPDEANLETDQGIAEGIETVQGDIMEQQEIYYSC